MKNLSLTSRMILRALEKTQNGKINISWKSGETLTFGEGELISELHLSKPEVLNQIASRGDIGLADAFIQGDLEISKPAEFFQWACLNDDRLNQAFHGTLWGTLIPKIRRWFQANTIDGAKKNIMAHYDLGNNFYSAWLDSSMSYSSAIFHSLNEDLTDAQNRKYDRIIDELEIGPHHHVLEIGCGWGGFFSRAIERTGCKVTAVMNSPAQAEYNRAMIKRKGLEKYVDLQLKDYRLIEGQFDKLASIEMIEAVGEKYWPTYFNKVASSLKNKGQALIQSITIREDRFDDYQKTQDFIKSYIFPGGMLLTNAAINSQARASGMNSARPYEFGLSYAETLKRWSENFSQAVANGDLPQIDSRFQRLWKLYLTYCEGAFRANRINVGHYLLQKGSM